MVPYSSAGIFGQEVAWRGVSPQIFGREDDVEVSWSDAEKIPRASLVLCSAALLCLTEIERRRLFRVVVFCAPGRSTSGERQKVSERPYRAEWWLNARDTRSGRECGWILEYASLDAAYRDRGRVVFMQWATGRKARRDLARPAHEVSCSPLLWGSLPGITGQ